MKKTSDVFEKCAVRYFESSRKYDRCKRTSESVGKKTKRRITVYEAARWCGGKGARGRTAFEVLPNINRSLRKPRSHCRARIQTDLSTAITFSVKIHTKQNELTTHEAKSSDTTAAHGNDRHTAGVWRN